MVRCYSLNRLRTGPPTVRVPRADAVTGNITISKRKAGELKVSPSLFAEEQQDADIYEYATHFRRQMKARLLKHKIVPQIVRETTLASEDFKKANGMPLRRIEDPATIAWKLGTGAYYKGGGRRAAVAVGACESWRLLRGTGLQTHRFDRGCQACVLCGADVLIEW